MDTKTISLVLMLGLLVLLAIGMPLGMASAILAVIIAAMSSIIGGEAVLLGLIALPQMLRLGYDRNLAIGTICAPGSLGTTIPPSIVLIIRTQLRPQDATLPDPQPGEPVGTQKLGLFLAFLFVLTAGIYTVLFLRALFFTSTGQNANLVDGVDPISWGATDYVPWLGGIVAICLGLTYFPFGIERTTRGWLLCKGLVAPIVVIGAVMGSIYGYITGITEAAGMGALAIYLLITIYQKDINAWMALLAANAKWFTLFVLLLLTLRLPAVLKGLWDSLRRTLKSTGTIIWVTVGTAALAGAYTIAGGPTYVADFILGSDLPTMGIILSMMLIVPAFPPIVQRLPLRTSISSGNSNHAMSVFGSVGCSV